jgi:CSLREA domain-containing protein
VAAGPEIASFTFVVNSTADSEDGPCTPRCTLREAITGANIDPARDTIEFDIPRSDPGCNAATKVCTIALVDGLPQITEPLVIDGYTQPGSRENTLAEGTDAALKIVLDGSQAGIAAGLIVAGGHTTIRGLVVREFSLGGIVLSDTAGNAVEGNFIGTSAAGTAAAGNDEGVVVEVDSTFNRIGGRSPAARNLISGNDDNGVRINSNDNEVVGNLIGTDKTGTQDLGNGSDGVLLTTSPLLGGAPTDHLVAGNVIAFNGGAGVNVAQSAGTGNRILGNSIFANDGLGIDLGGDGRTANDPDDPDSGPNNLQNFPQIDSATSTDTKTTVEGGLNSLANRTFRIQFFANPSVDGAEGKTFLGQKDVTTDSAGDAEFSFTTRKRVPPGQAITATATRLGTGDTSEFSAAERVRKA